MAYYDPSPFLTKFADATGSGLDANKYSRELAGAAVLGTGTQLLA